MLRHVPKPRPGSHDRGVLTPLPRGDDFSLSSRCDVVMRVPFILQIVDVCIWPKRRAQLFMAIFAFRSDRVQTKFKAS